MAYSLSYDTFNENMIEGMRELLHTGHLADVTLAVEGKILKAHKTVLAVYSPYFRDLFVSNPHPHPLIFMRGVQHDIMRDLLAFMYVGSVQIEAVDVDEFVATAASLQVKGLSSKPAPPTEQGSAVPNILNPPASTECEVDFSEVAHGIRFNTNTMNTMRSMANGYTGDGSSPRIKEKLEVEPRRSERNKTAAESKRVFSNDAHDDEPAKKTKMEKLENMICVESGMVLNSLSTSVNIKDPLALSEECAMNDYSGVLWSEEDTICIDDDDDDDDINVQEEEYDEEDNLLQVARSSPTPLAKQPVRQRAYKSLQEGEPVQVIEFRDAHQMRALLIDNHRYSHFQKPTAEQGVLVMRCNQSTHKRCSAKLLVSPNKCFALRGSHNHDGSSTNLSKIFKSCTEIYYRQTLNYFE